MPRLISAGRSASCATCRAPSSASAISAASAFPSAEGTTFRFDRTESDGGAERVFLPHPQIFEAVEPGHTLLLDDGKIRMVVTAKGASSIEATVLVGGTLASRKGISLPDTVLPIGPLTDKDKQDLDFALRLGVDWVALSFVQRGEDVKLARQLVGQAASLMSKIEKPAAIHDLENIIAHSDGLMVARGDLGVELPVERVPGLQKQIVSKARAAGKPVVVATQMLESMISSPVPTRAEVSDVATAVFDGADAVMLSAESAVGKYPIEAIRTMDRIAIEAEADPSYGALLHATRTPPQATAADAIAAAAHTVADTLKPRLHHLLHGDRLDRPARRPRAARPVRDRPLASAGDGAQARPRVGRALRADQRPGEPGGDGAQGLPHRLRRGLRQGRRGRHHRRRRAARLARHHQHAAHRPPGRGGQPRGGGGVRQCVRPESPLRGRERSKPPPFVIPAPRASEARVRDQAGTQTPFRWKGQAQVASLFSNLWRCSR